MAPKGRTADEILARMAESSHGVATRGEMLVEGVTLDEIKRRVTRGALIRVHRGVYRVGHMAPSVEADYLAAVLACGDGAALCGPAAAHLHRLTRTPPPPPSVLTPTERRVPGVRTRRSRNLLTEAEAAIVAGIPATSVPRTLVDLAPLLSLDALARACHEAGVLHKTTPAMVEPLIAGRPGARKLRAVMSGEQKVSLSVLERRFLALLGTACLALPDETNRIASGRRVDCRWTSRRLTVELDSYAFHNSRHAWEQDRRREREAYARGDQHRRYTWRDVSEVPGPMLRELRALLS